MIHLVQTKTNSAIIIITKSLTTGAISRTNDVDGEWPVSYHGTKQLVADSITENGYEIRCGKRFLYGHGVYSTPTPSVAEKYATAFEHEGERYNSCFCLIQGDPKLCLPLPGRNRRGHSRTDHITF